MVGVGGVVRGRESGAGACAESSGGGVECDDGRTGCDLGGSWAHHLPLPVEGGLAVHALSVRWRPRRRLCLILVVGVRR